VTTAGSGKNKSGAAPVHEGRTIPTRWTDDDWDAGFQAYVPLVEIIRTDWISAALAIGSYDDRDTGAEIDALMRMIPLRDQLADEIKEQDKKGGIRRAFESRFRFDAKSKPHTSALLSFVIQSAAPISLYTKNIYRRPRPNQLEPRLLNADIEVVPVPGHPAYPSGHSFQSHLAAMALATVSTRDGTSLADSIAKNREVAGLHYPSDSAAGKRLAEALWPLFSRNPHIMKCMEAAKAEWL
jgi:acid phosphatase (class A)